MNVFKISSTNQMHGLTSFDRPAFSTGSYSLLPNTSLSMPCVLLQSTLMDEWMEVQGWSKSSHLCNANVHVNIVP